MKVLKNCLLAASMMTIGLSGFAQKLPAFKSESIKKGPVSLPYTDIQNYFGYVKPGSAPDEERDGKKFYYVYVWIPAVAPEIGVRMVSPAPAKMKPKEGKDFVSPLWAEGESDTKNFFDTWISFERAEGVTSADDIKTKGKSASWKSYGQNDDSSELPAQPSGSKYNSCLRIVSEPSNPAKALVVGLYRIGFTTYKRGEVQGSFVAQIGAPVKLPGVKVAKDLESLAKALGK
mgnify:CR=1 FL=1